ncbi:phosphoribosylanthranilate isomerase [Algoriphagus jejuensis]|uniref:N-(5'-phosphoribosyl)anthranilate isomerase n=1 Tax=Algoriphagus jejuensis TaxID=419934 RepID=A0ABP3Y9V6_9BACT
MELKVCGMRDPENIRSLISEIEPDWMGLIFYSKSPRFVHDEMAPQILDLEVKKVGVFVNESLEEILRKIKLFGLSAVQLHGKESAALVEELSKKTKAEIWKVISVKKQIDWESLRGFLPFVSKFLFDTATVEHGGSGRKFDWTQLERYPFDKSFLLSGGLDEASAEEVFALAQKIPQLAGVDLNSKFEDAPGLKNIERLKNFKSDLEQPRANNQ